MYYTYCYKYSTIYAYFPDFQHTLIALFDRYKHVPQFHIIYLIITCFYLIIALMLIMLFCCVRRLSFVYTLSLICLTFCCIYFGISLCRSLINKKILIYILIAVQI